MIPLVHTVKLKPIIKAQISGKLVTSGSENTRLKKMIMIIIIIASNRKTIH